MLTWLTANPEQASATAALGSLFVSMAALVVAGLSIYFAYRGLKLQQVHNQLSVRPVGSIPCADYEDCVRVRITNDGLGPLLIDCITVRNKESSETSSNLISLMPEAPENISWKNFSSGKWNCIRPGDSLILIELEGDSADKDFAEFRDRVREKLSNIEIILQYKDIYGNAMPAARRDLKWFSRRLAKSKTA